MSDSISNYRALRLVVSVPLRDDRPVLWHVFARNVRSGTHIERTLAQGSLVNTDRTSTTEGCLRELAAALEEAADVLA